MEEKNKKETVKKIKLSTVFISGAIFIGVAILILIVVFYKFNKSPFAKSMGSIIPFPAIILDNSIITTSEISSNVQSIKQFYENQDFSSLGYRIDFGTDEGQKRLKIREKELIDKMIEDKIIEKIAKEKGISISDKIIDESVDRKIKEYGSDSFVRDNLEKLYGWSLEDFKNKIVKPSLYKDELEKWVNENENKEENESAKLSADKTREQITSGEEFATVAISNSDGITSKNGGHLGVFKKEYMAPELQEKVTSLEVGAVSDVLESKLGYHIIKLNEKKMDGEEEVLYDLSQIYFPKISFADWLSEKIKEAKIKVWISDYNWNNDTGLVEFSDEEMRIFQEKALKEMISDASLLPI